MLRKVLDMSNLYKKDSTESKNMKNMITKTASNI